VEGKREKKPQTDRQKVQNKPQKGYKRLFINLGKKDGFFPGVLMQTLNRYVGGRQEVGHIDLLDTISYFEVPEKDARKVMLQLTGIRFKSRTVRCNDAEEGGKNELQPKKSFGRKTPYETERSPKERGGGTRQRNDHKGKRDDWRNLMHQVPRDLRGEEPDFSEEGWARRKPRKK
jgi:ATP-dependent RNA helicase DeaD